MTSLVTKISGQMWFGGSTYLKCGVVACQWSTLYDRFKKRGEEVVGCQVQCSGVYFTIGAHDIYTKSSAEWAVVSCQLQCILYDRYFTTCRAVQSEYQLSGAAEYTLRYIYQVQCTVGR